MPNGLDPYDSQMIMMPYGGSPFSINPTEHGESTPPYPTNHYQKRNSVDSEVNRGREFGWKRKQESTNEHFFFF